MRRIKVVFFVLGLSIAFFPVAAQNPPVGSSVVKGGRIVIPDSSVSRPEDAGKRAHTNYMIFIPQGQVSPNTVPVPGFENPASLGCVYKVGPKYAGCNPQTGGNRHPSGGWGGIAIVDAYDNPYAAANLMTFSAQYGLPKAIFTQVYCVSGGTCSPTNAPPPVSDSWGLEEALDIEWAHAMAPNAQIILIEAASNQTADLLNAEIYAGIYLTGVGGGQISNSWGSQEFSGETNYDGYFLAGGGRQTVPLVYFASAGDTYTVPEWPSTSPFVVSSGGTFVHRDGSGNFLDEECWDRSPYGTGGGPSAFEAPPIYQYGLAGKTRLTPDLSFDSDQDSAVSVYDQLNGGWIGVFGTSVASPSLAGIANLAGNRLPNNIMANNLLYGELWGQKTYPADFRDITIGGSGLYAAHTFWDYCTGIGSPLGRIGK
jgi:kumamolisin